MVNTRKKMHVTNAKVKEYLKEQGFTDFYMFPHTRHLKDYHLRDCEFDMFAFNESKLWFFQIKSNKVCPNKIKEKYKELIKHYSIIPCWITYINKRRLTKTHPNSIELYSIGKW